MEESGETIPDLENKVEADDHLGFEWAAFAELSTERQMGMGVGPIPWSAIDRYAERWGTDDADDYARFCRLMGAMDREFLRWHAEQAKKD
jgi:hypothetical protein